MRSTTGALLQFLNTAPTGASSGGTGLSLSLPDLHRPPDRELRVMVVDDDLRQ